MEHLLPATNSALEPRDGGVSSLQILPEIQAFIQASLPMANKILVVENDECSRTGIAAFFEAYGFEVRSTHSAHQAIALGRCFVPDILISDWMLGEDLDGVDVARTLLHASCPQLAIILITGRPMDELRSEAFGLPVYSFMRKPLSLFDLRAAVDLILKRSANDKS